MQVHSTSAYAARREPRIDDAPAQLRGHALVAARVALASVAALALAIFVVSVPTRYTQLRALAATGLGEGWTSSEARAALEQLGLPVAIYAASIVTLDIIFVSVFIAVAALLVVRRADEGMALFVAIFLVSFGVNWTTDPAWWAGTVWYGPVRILNYIAWSTFTGFFFLFPDGRFVPSWTRHFAIGWIASNLIVDIFIPLRQWVVFLIWLSGLAICLFAQIYRYRRISGPVQRQQTKWVVFGFAVPFTLILTLVAIGSLFPSLERPGVPGLIYDITGRLLSYLLFLPIPLSICIAVLRYRLWDIDILINRALVYSTLSASIAAMYVLLVGGLGALLQAQGNLLISLIGTGLIAVLFQPLRARLQRGVNRLMYGERDDPYAALSRLSQRLDATLATDAVLPTIVETIKDALKLPYVAIALKESDQLIIAAESYDKVPETTPHKSLSLSPAHLVTLPLTYQGEVVGELRLCPRLGEDGFSVADQRLLDDLARQAGVAAHAVRLTADLQRSRERLVTAREEERRRLRRDLHDGLGSTLAGLNLQAGALRGLIARDPAAADALVVDLRADIRAAIADIRRLAYDLRPPALDELGLIGAIRTRAAHYGNGDHGEHSLQIAVEAPEELPPLPAAVEVAAYRIVQEALTNVVHHAQARNCVIRLALADRLQLQIVDDGVGLAAVRDAGVGLLSMRERAAELGGACTIEPARGGGTCVRAWLPLN
jgi:signal transduction histidine kinase